MRRKTVNTLKHTKRVLKSQKRRRSWLLKVCRVALADSFYTGFVPSIPAHDWVYWDEDQTQWHNHCRLSKGWPGAPAYREEDDPELVTLLSGDRSSDGSEDIRMESPPRESPPSSEVVML